MTKSVVVYDKWLSSLGGGEVVACNIAKLLSDIGYQVTFICGKKISKENIKEKTGVDLKKIEFIEVWNDEVKVKEISKDKDLFINTSFMDYTMGNAKKNIYYTHFPTKPYESIRGRIVNKIILPVLAQIIRPSEFITEINAPTVIYKKPAYLLEKENKIAIPYLNQNGEYAFEFTVFFENFCQSLLDNFHWGFSDANVLKKHIYVDHYNNTIVFKVQVKAQSPTIYLNLNYKNVNPFLEGKIYLFYPKVTVRKLGTPWSKYITQRIESRLRAGVFANTLQRLDSYNLILANSEFTKKWIKNYWGRNAQILYPPVEMMFKKHKLAKQKKEKIICSVGRFFTLGHGKKQEILIESFKKLYDRGYKDWQLHLVGGLGMEPTSLEFAKKIKNMSEGYPIFLHFNASRETVEDIYMKSLIYWHAAGYGESETDDPIRFEHFGIAPIEAISSKCFPILFKGGGLKEIISKVKLKEEEHLFVSIDELVDKTINYINGGVETINWDEVLKLVDQNFSMESFRKVFKKLI